MEIKDYRTIRSFLEDARDIIDLSKVSEKTYDGMWIKKRKNPLNDEDLDLLNNIISCIFTVETLIDKLYLADLPEDEEEPVAEITDNDDQSVYDQLRENWSMQDIENTFCGFNLRVLHESTDKKVLERAHHMLYKKIILGEEE